MECIGDALCRERGLSGAVTGQRRGARSGAVLLLKPWLAPSVHTWQ